MKLIFSENAWEDYLYWQKNDGKLLLRINELIKDIQRNGYQGIGKPEPLRQNLAGWWSRRIDNQHRIVYRIQDNSILIAQVRYHY
jgi:toxin YoeB